MTENIENMKNLRKYYLERICISQIPHGLITTELGNMYSKLM
jgi:hypothetical protein